MDLTYILNKQEEIARTRIFFRDVELKPSKEFITVITGPRRAGKTYIIYEYIRRKKLSHEDYIFLDFEDLELIDATAKGVLEIIEEFSVKVGKEPKYIFLDEIQSLDKWEKLLYSLYNKKRYYIVVTGSNSKLLSKEISTNLRGRYTSLFVLPFSFREFVKSKGEEIPELFSTYSIRKFRKLFEEYLDKGGFLPAHDNLHFYDDYLDVTIFRDIVERYRVDSIGTLNRFLKMVVASFAKSFSVNKAYNTLKSLGIRVGKDTLYNYLTYLENSFLIFPLMRYDSSLRKVESSLPKLYLNDVGLLNSMPTLKRERGRILENVVFLELFRRDFRPNKELFYWKDEKNREVDFITQRTLYQVTYRLKDALDRELTPLLQVPKMLRKYSKIILEGEASEPYKEENVEVVPLWLWLLWKSFPVRKETIL